MRKRCTTLTLLAAFLFAFAGSAIAANDKRLEGVVDIQKLVLGMDLKTFSDGEKTPEKEILVRQHLEDAGWVPNKGGIFTIRMPNNTLAFRGDDELGNLYIMPVSRMVIPEKRPRPAVTNYFVVADEHVEYANFAKMSGFGYIGRGSHSNGERFGLLPFNQDFIRLLAHDRVTSYIFTLTGMDVERAKRNRRDFELYLKCRFTSQVQDYIRRQANIKLSHADSPNSRRIMEYLLCVDILGAIVYDTKEERVVREWRINP